MSFPSPRSASRSRCPRPADIDDALDERRVRALVIDRLESAAADGHSLVARSHIVQAIRDEPLDPPCPLTPDIVAVAETFFDPEIALAVMADASPAYQLARLRETRHKISTLVRKRMRARALPIEADWAATIDGLLGTSAQEDPDEPLARLEKASALKVLAQSRISVLIGPAGTGKTTLLRVLCTLPGVQQRGRLLLAPTGKARVRLENGLGKTASTLAQLLKRSDRYDPQTGRYTAGCELLGGFTTVIVDECSMLTENQLDALLDALTGTSASFWSATRGSFHRSGLGARSSTSSRSAAPRAERRVPALRPDLRGAHDDATATPRRSANADRPDMRFGALGRTHRCPTRKRRSGTTWQVPPTWARCSSPVEDTAGSARTASRRVGDGLVSEADVHDSLGFEVSYGGAINDLDVYFNSSNASKAEAWQMLSPIRGEPEASMS